MVVLSSLVILTGLLALIHICMYFVVCTFTNVFSIVYVRGGSMQPSLNAGDKVLVLRWGCRLFVCKGRIALISLPYVHYLDNIQGGDNSRNLFIKRIVGTYGDKLPKYKRDTPIPKNHVFVVGDHHESSDSRGWGPLPISTIQGIVVARISRG